MKNVILIFLLLISCVSVHAQESDSKPRNAFEVQGGLTLSSRYNSRNYPGFVEYGVGVGAYAGAGYEVRFTPKWSLMPKVEFAYGSNCAKKMPTDQWYSLYTFSVPVLVNYRVPLLDNWALRFGVGPYGEYILGGRTQKGWNIVKNQGFEMRVTAGVKAEVAFEMGCLVLGLGYKCSFLDNNYISDLQTFSLGVGCRF